MTHEPRVKGTLENGSLKLTNKFGNENVNGLQHKDAVQIDGKDYFVKLDDLNPSVNGSWENDFNAQYSSVSETLASILLKNMAPEEHFDSAIYNFSCVELDGETQTGTVSRTFLEKDEKERAHNGFTRTGTYSQQFLKEFEEEHVLAIGTRYDTHTAMAIEDYAENIIDVPTETRFKNLVARFEENHVPKEHAEAFLVKQAAFDMLIGNQDRLNNPSNFIVAYNVKTDQSRLINFDYGRSLPINGWTTTMEEKYDLEVFLDEDRGDFAKQLNATSDSILNGLTKQQAQDFLKDHGFSGFRIDTKGVERDLEAFKEQIKSSNVPFEKYALAKAESFKDMLQSDYSKNFYKDISKDTQEPSFKRFDTALAYVPFHDELDGANIIDNQLQREAYRNNTGKYRPIVILSEKNGRVAAVQARSNCDENKWPPRYALQESKEAGFVSDTALCTNAEQILYFEADTLQDIHKIGRLTPTDQQQFIERFQKENAPTIKKERNSYTKSLEKQYDEPSL